MYFRIDKQLIAKVFYRIPTSKYRGTAFEKYNYWMLNPSSKRLVTSVVGAPGHLHLKPFISLGGTRGEPLCASCRDVLRNLYQRLRALLQETEEDSEVEGSQASRWNCQLTGNKGTITQSRSQKTWGQRR